MSTMMQRKAIRNIIKHNDLKKSITVRQAMLDAGYAKSTAKQSTITKSHMWLALIDKILPDNKLLEKHAEGLDATRTIVSRENGDYTVPDYNVRARYIELGYRLKGKLRDNSVNILNTGGNMNLEFISKEDKPIEL
jgi:hypothetical protein